MLAIIGTVRIPVQIDVGIGDAITPAAKTCAFPALLDMDPPRLKTYPRETVIAEKFETIVKRGIANSRMKDYYDLWKLSTDPAVDLATARLAVRRTFGRRQTTIPTAVPEGLSDEFAADQTKLRQWNAFMRKNRLQDEGMSFIRIVSELRCFLMRLAED